jgi:tetratricopeptide (TPR) repeat protein
LLEVYLFKDVDPVKHKATVSNGVLNITLFKREAEIWGRCEISFEDYEKDQMKKELLSRKQEATKQRTELETKLQAQYTDRKVTEERQAVRQQMAIDAGERERMDHLKAEEKKAAEEEVYRTLSQLSSAAENNAAQTKSESKAATLPKHHAASEDYDMIDDREEFLSPTNSVQPTASILKQTNQNKVTTSTNSVEKKEKKKVSIIEDIDEDEEEEENEDDNEEPEVDEEEEDEMISSSTAPGKEEEMNEEEIKYIPPPRQFLDVSTGEVADSGNSKFKINFTPRLFPTPQRESKAAEEEDWIAKNRRHLKKHGVFSKIMANKKTSSNPSQSNNDISEEDPVWLKAKGDDFFRSGDHKSALNAYSAAIDSYENPESEGFHMDDTLLACYSNRSLCYLRLNLSQDCKLDCDLVIKNLIKQMDSLTPSLAAAAEAKSAGEPANPSSSAVVAQKNKLFTNLIKMLLRRGVVLCQLGQYSESLSDYISAQVKIQQTSMYSIEQLANQFHITLESIQKDIDRLKLIIASENAKKKADSYFAEKNVSQALEKYHEAIALIPIYVSALSNRSACYLILKDYENALKDCNLALEILQHSSTSSGSNNNLVGLEGDPKNLHFLRTMLHALIPLPNTEKQQTWVMNISLKKAVICLQLNQLAEAIQIYEAMVVLDPKNEVLKKELERLQAKSREEEEVEGQQSGKENNNVDNAEKVAEDQSQEPEKSHSEVNKKNTDLFEID